jgi:hypothetical protein
LAAAAADLAETDRPALASPAALAVVPDHQTALAEAGLLDKDLLGVRPLIRFLLAKLLAAAAPAQSGQAQSQQVRQSMLAELERPR